MKHWDRSNHERRLVSYDQLEHQFSKNLKKRKSSWQFSICLRSNYMENRQFVNLYFKYSEFPDPRAKTRLSLGVLDHSLEDLKTFGYTSDQVRHHLKSIHRSKLKSLIGLIPCERKALQNFQIAWSALCWLSLSRFLSRLIRPLLPSTISTPEKLMSDFSIQLTLAIGSTRDFSTFHGEVLNIIPLIGEKNSDMLSTKIWRWIIFQTEAHYYDLI